MSGMLMADLGALHDDGAAAPAVPSAVPPATGREVLLEADRAAGSEIRTGARAATAPEPSDFEARANRSGPSDGGVVERSTRLNKRETVSGWKSKEM